VRLVIKETPRSLRKSYPLVIKVDNLEKATVQPFTAKRHGKLTRIAGWFMPDKAYKPDASGAVSFINDSLGLDKYRELVSVEPKKATYFLEAVNNIFLEITNAGKETLSKMMRSNPAGVKRLMSAVFDKVNSDVEKQGVSLRAMQPKEGYKNFETTKKVVGLFHGEKFLDLPVKQGTGEGKQAKGGFGNCTDIALVEHRKNNSEVYVGVAVERSKLHEALKVAKEIGIGAAQSEAFPHAWNVADGKIVDRTLGSEIASKHAYFGVKVPQEELDKIKSGDDLAKWHVVRAMQPKTAYYHRDIVGDKVHGTDPKTGRKFKGVVNQIEKDGILVGLDTGEVLKVPFGHVRKQPEVGDLPPLHVSEEKELYCLEEKPKFKQDVLSKKRGDAVVWVDTNKFDQEWKKDEGFYIGLGGVASISNRYQRFGEFLRTGQEIEMPQVSLRFNPSRRSQVGFINGRHRFAVLRDAGLKSIPVSISKKEADKFAELFGGSNG